MSASDPSSAPVRLTLYTRAGCHLCDEMAAAVAAALAAGTYVLEEVDVDAERALQDRYGLVLPVLAIEGEDAFETRLDPAALRRRVEGLRAGNA